MVAQAFNSSTGRGRQIWVQGQPGPQSEFQDSQGNSASKNQKKKRNLDMERKHHSFYSE